MKHSLGRLFALVASVFAMSDALADDVVLLCPNCGWEYFAGDVKCPNASCGRALPKSRAAAQADADAAAILAAAQAAVAETEAAATTEFEKLVVAAQARDQAAFRSIPESDPAARLAAIRNTLALDALLSNPPASHVQLEDLARELLRKIHTGGEPCPVCHGTKEVKPTSDGTSARGNSKSVQLITDARGNPINSQAKREKKYACPFCEGKGELPKVRDPKMLAAQLATGRRTFALRLSPRDARADLAGVLVPEDVRKQLPLDAHVRLAATAAVICPDCGGSGLSACKYCEGFGRLECDNKDFHAADKKGNAVLGGNGKSNVQHVETVAQDPRLGPKCPQCGGSAPLAKSVPCEHCSAHGYAPCKFCDGTGHSPVCRTCQGRGIVPCKVCRGQGKDRAGKSCEACEGLGKAPCNKCEGSGRRVH